MICSIFFLACAACGSGMGKVSGDTPRPGRGTASPRTPAAFDRGWLKFAGTLHAPAGGRSPPALLAEWLHFRYDRVKVWLSSVGRVFCEKRGTVVHKGI